MEQGIKLNIWILKIEKSFCLSSLVLKFSEASRFSCGVRIKLPLIMAVDGGDKGPRAGDWDWDLRRERREGTSSGGWCSVFTHGRAPAWCWPWPPSRAQSQDTHSHTVTSWSFVNWKDKVQSWWPCALKMKLLTVFLVLTRQSQLPCHWSNKSGLEALYKLNKLPNYKQ